jgi:hypothetical protein
MSSCSRSFEGKDEGFFDHEMPMECHTHVIGKAFSSRDRFRQQVPFSGSYAVSVFAREAASLPKKRLLYEVQLLELCLSSELNVASSPFSSS